MSNIVAERPTTSTCFAWCVDHYRDSDGDSYCVTEETVISGMRMKVSSGTLDDLPALFVMQDVTAPEALTPEAARGITAHLARLAELVEAARLDVQ